MPRLWMPVVFALSVLAAACANDALSGLKEPPPGDPPPPPPPADDALLVSPESIQFTVSQLGDQRTQTVRILDQVLEPVTFTGVEVFDAATNGGSHSFSTAAASTIGTLTMDAADQLIVEVVVAAGAGTIQPLSLTGGTLAGTLAVRSSGDAGLAAVEVGDCTR